MEYAQIVVKHINFLQRNIQDGTERFISSVKAAGKSIQNGHSDQVGQIYGINCAGPFDYQIFTKGKWRCAYITSHPIIIIEITTISHRPTFTSPVVVSGA